MPESESDAKRPACQAGLRYGSTLHDSRSLRWRLERRRRDGATRAPVSTPAAQGEREVAPLHPDESADFSHI